MHGENAQLYLNLTTVDDNNLNSSMNHTRNEYPQTFSSSLSGPLGLVVVPDCATIERAYALAEEIMPRDSQYVLGKDSLPHLTLYHGKLANLPVITASEILKELRTQLIGRKFTLNNIRSFGGNFIFWNVDLVSSADNILQGAHITALKLSQHLDRSASSKAIAEEGLSLTAGELENVRLFGHPLVRSLYMHHITLGFNQGISGDIADEIKCEWSIEVASVELVKIGHPGRVEGVINLSS